MKEVRNTNELEKLKAENEQLKRDQDFLFQLIDIGLMVIETWARENGLLDSGKNTDQNPPKRDNEVRVFLQEIRKADQDVFIDRLVTLLDSLKDRN